MSNNRSGYLLALLLGAAVGTLTGLRWLRALVGKRGIEKICRCLTRIGRGLTSVQLQTDRL